MRARPTHLLVPLLLAAAGCNTTPTSESLSGAAEAQECSSSTLAYGGCARGAASKEEHGYHRALLQRGDRVRVTLKRIDGDLNPGLALKSPKYSVAVRWDSVVPREDSVEKIWTIPSTGFYTFVAFPWSNRGHGSYQMDLTCVSGPCAEGAGMNAELAGACIGEARDCALNDLGDASDARSVAALFQSCLHGDDMPAVCASACGAGTACNDTIERLRPFAGRGAECIEQIQSCIEDCVPHNTTADPIADINASPEMSCWAGNRANTCAAFGMGLADCRIPAGGEQQRPGADVTADGYTIGSEAWCSAVCVAREGDTLNEMCNDRCAPQQGADDETPDPVNAEAAE